MCNLTTAHDVIAINSKGPQVAPVGALKISARIAEDLSTSRYDTAE